VVKKIVGQNNVQAGVSRNEPPRWPNDFSTQSYRVDVRPEAEPEGRMRCPRPPRWERHPLAFNLSYDEII
jgi:hypothetical protein